MHASEEVKTRDNRKTQCINILHLLPLRRWTFRKPLQRLTRSQERFWFSNWEALIETQIWKDVI